MSLSNYITGKKRQKNEISESFDMVKKANTGKKFDPLRDPRPDLEADSELWQELLAGCYEAENKSGYLTGILHGFRCGGCRLEYSDSKGSYTIRPEVGGHNWKSEQEYNDLRDSWLKPHADRIRQALALLPAPYLQEQQGEGEGE